MGLRDKVRGAALDATTGRNGEPAASLRATQLATAAASAATSAGHTELAAAAGAAAALIVAADCARNQPHGGDGYATFDDEDGAG
ncbi:hypothetical protein ACH4FX_12195 [Streptomyces sp. NPDC018019]|uniref:hypothetical protein n=1 Tax=Streptomyces sp. NPDC018019 TaxID=3365030 RepID=UPI0037B90C67